MVFVEFDKDDKKKQLSLHVKGHAEFDNAGQDIVCSAVSILTYTLAQNVKVHNTRGLCKDNPMIKFGKGDAVITCRAKDDKSFAELLGAYLYTQTGYDLLAHNYPKYVKLKMIGQAS